MRRYMMNFTKARITHCGSARDIVLEIIRDTHTHTHTHTRTHTMTPTQDYTRTSSVRSLLAVIEHSNAHVR
jgi:hypothetical protein